VQITDRTKDLIKSGGEWISSIDVETMIMDHPRCWRPADHRGAAIRSGWERPLACVVPKPGMTLDPTRDRRIPQAPAARNSALPDEVVLIEAVPKTSVGKFEQEGLRERFKAGRRRTDGMADATRRVRPARSGNYDRYLAPLFFDAVRGRPGRAAAL